MKLTKIDVMRLDARSGWYKKLGVSSKAALLNHAQKSGLPVPNGVTLLDSAWGRLIESGIVTVEGSDVTVEAADELLERFALHALRRSVAVRPAFARVGDSAENTSPPDITLLNQTHLDIAPTDKVGLINALIDTWRAPLPNRLSDDSVRRDMLVMEMVDIKTEGVAFTQAGYADDLVVFDADQTHHLPKIKSLENSTLENGWQRRLQQLLRGVRLTFNLHGTDWEIRWADDSTRCWLLQIRPILTPPPRIEQFGPTRLQSLWSEPLTPLLGSMLAYVQSESDWLQRLDQTLPKNRPILINHNNQLHVNETLLNDVTRAWGFPDSRNEANSEIHWVRLLRKLWVLIRLPSKLQLANISRPIQSLAELTQAYQQLLTTSLPTVLLLGQLIDAIPERVPLLNGYRANLMTTYAAYVAQIRQQQQQLKASGNQFADQLVATGSLPTAEHLWAFSIEELPLLERSLLDSPRAVATP